MAGWLAWLIFGAAYPLLFIGWSWVPLHRLDRIWAGNNEYGRPFLHSLALVGVPAYYAHAVSLPAAWLLIPITFLAAQYAVLSGRFLRQQMLIAGWVMLATIAAIWIAFYAL